jgi:hypothetical protein
MPRSLDFILSNEEALKEFYNRNGVTIILFWKDYCNYIAENVSEGSKLETHWSSAK